MLYLASNFSSLDPRDMIYGLHGILQYTDTTTLLKPDYSKSLLEVYRDSVEAAFLNFRNVDVLLYVTGNERSSWIPRWKWATKIQPPTKVVSGQKYPMGKGGRWAPLSQLRTRGALASAFGSRSAGTRTRRVECTSGVHGGSARSLWLDGEVWYL